VCVQGLFGGRKGLQGLGVVGLVGGWECCNIVGIQEEPIGRDLLAHGLMRMVW
jgi:hypothetical protein